MKSVLRERLSERIGLKDIREICLSASGPANDSIKHRLYLLITDNNDRVGYNALWIFTHFSDNDKIWLHPRRNELIDLLLKETHDGKKRLLLRILSDIPVTIEDVRSDYLDYCLGKINSTEPYAVRAWSIEQAFGMCRFFPELLDELKEELDMMEYGELSPGLLSARRNIEKKLSRLLHISHK